MFIVCSAGRRTILNADLPGGDVRTLILSIAIAMLGCRSVDRPADRTDLGHPPHENTCWSWCDWPMPPPACLMHPDTIEYLILFNEQLHASSADILDDPPAECSCISFRLTPAGMIRGLSIHKSTDVEGTQLLADALEASSPYPPPAGSALCLTEQSVRFSVGGKREAH